MKLSNFSITNYRSIIQASRLTINDLTILIGQNNEGKSNILNALAVALAAINPGIIRFLRSRNQYKIKARMLGMVGIDNSYNWENDYPLSLQKIGNGTSKFTFEFNLNPQEIVELKDSLKLSKLILSENLRILVEINEDNEISYKAFKKSRLNKWEKSSLSDKTTIGICFFIGRKIDFTYIPAIRASNAAIDVVKSMVERELLTLEENADYSQALKTIEDLQKPILDKISQKITQPLREFIPQIKSVEIEISSDERRKALTGCKIIIDDGTPTPIERKGDGIKSLAVISLLRKSIVDKKISILALEEPESHLHPSAIHRLKGVIDEIACSHQVILTTHCPLFVNRVNIKNNIIISNNEAKPAKNINEIRDILGVRASDNLMHAKLVLVVEGDCDKIILESLFSFYSNKLMYFLREGLLVVKPLFGASKLSYEISTLKSSLCSVHAFLDHDKSGKEAVNLAVKDGLIKVADYHFSICNGMQESEIEDCLNAKIYSQKIKDEYGVSLNHANFRSSNKKWSDRLKSTFYSSGKNWDVSIENQLKKIVSDKVKDNPSIALNIHKKSSIDELIQSLEEKLAKST